jgi:hypothetical protein
VLLHARTLGLIQAALGVEQASSEGPLKRCSLCKAHVQGVRRVWAGEKDCAVGAIQPRHEERYERAWNDHTRAVLLWDRRVSARRGWVGEKVRTFEAKRATPGEEEQVLTR